MEAAQSGDSPSAPYHESFRTGGEGTSGSAAVAAPSTADPSAAGPSTTAAPTAPTRSDGAMPAGWQEMFFSGGESALDDAKLARSLLRGILLPQDKERYRGRTTTEIMSSFYTSITSALLDADMLERGLAAAVELGRTWAERVAVAEADREVAQDRLAGAERKIREAQVEVDRLGQELRTTQTNLTRSLEATQLEITARQTAEVLVSDVTFEKQRTEEALEAALTEKAAAAEQAEAQKAAAEAQRTEVEALKVAVGAAEAAARTAEAAMRAAEAAAARAIEDFKASGAFKEEVLEASDACYLIGFRSCRAEVAEAFPDLDLSGIASPVRASDVTESESEQEPADDVPSAAEPITGEPAEVVEAEEAIPAVESELAGPGAAPEEVVGQTVSAEGVAPAEQSASSEVPTAEETVPEVAVEEAVEEVVATVEQNVEPL